MAHIYVLVTCSSVRQAAHFSASDVLVELIWAYADGSYSGAADVLWKSSSSTFFVICRVRLQLSEPCCLTRLKIEMHHSGVLTVCNSCFDQTLRGAMLRLPPCFPYLLFMCMSGFWTFSLHVNWSLRKAALWWYWYCEYNGCVYVFMEKINWCMTSVSP